MLKKKQYWCNCNNIVKTVVSRTRAKCDDCGQPMTPVATLQIELFRTMVRTHSAKEINGFEVDVQTANAICTVYDKLTDPAKKSKLLSFPINELGVKIWKFFN